MDNNSNLKNDSEELGSGNEKLSLFCSFFLFLGTQSEYMV